VPIRHAAYRAAIPFCRYLAIQHPTTDFYPPGVGGQAAYRNAGIAFQYRTRDEFARFLDGLALIEPGITPMADWRPEIEPGPPAQPRPGGRVRGARQEAVKRSFRTGAWFP
jgi:hypothetical protein